MRAYRNPMARTGQTLVDIPEATVRVPVDRPELVLGWEAKVQLEEGLGRTLAGLR